jgi:fatty acid desaturase
MTGLISPQELRRLSRRTWLPTVSQAVFVIATYLAVAWSVIRIDQIWYALLVWPVLGFLLAGFLGAAHDCAHGTHAPTTRANRLLGVVWASLVLFNFTIYKHYHLCHHRFTTVAGDTEPRGVFPSLGTYIRTLPMFTFFGSFWAMSLRVLSGRYPRFVPRRDRPAVRADNVALLGWILAVAAALWLAPGLTVKAYLVPMVFCFPMVFLTSIPEHYGCDEGPDPFRNTRSITSNWLFRVLFWNGNFHAEHHLYPSVPSYRLPVLHRRIGALFAHRRRSYIRFHADLLAGLITTKPGSDRVTLNPTTRVIDPALSDLTEQNSVESEDFAAQHG